MKFKEEFNIVGFFYMMSGIYWISIGFMGAYWTLYFANLGLSYSSIALLFLMYPISSVIFEIPTGAIADVYGRKWSVFLSYLITGLAFVGALLSGSNFPLLTVFYFIAGVSFTLESGALESWFVDTVNYKGKSEQLHRLFGRWGSISSVGFVVGPFLGGILVTRGVDKAFWATAIVMLLLSIFVLVFGREEYFERGEANISRGFKEAFKTGKLGFKHTFQQPVILMMTSIMTVVTLANTISYNAYQPYVVEVGIPPSFLGFALSGAGIIAIFSLNYSHKFTKRLGGNKRCLLIFTFLLGLAVVGVGLITYVPLLFLSMVLYASFYDLSSGDAPAFMELFNKFIPSEIRATVISTNSFNMNIGQILGLIAFGLISDHLNLQIGIVIAGILIISTSFMYLKVGATEQTITQGREQ